MIYICFQNSDMFTVKAFQSTFIYFFFILGLTQTSYTREKENTLSFKNVMTKKETKAYKILKLEAQENGIHITAAEGKVCFLPYREFMADWIVEGKCRGDGHIVKAYSKEVEKIKELFTNARNYQISCSLRDDKVVGYSFFGQTVTAGTPSLVSRSRAFDLTQYPEPEPARSPGAVEKVFKDSFRALGRLLF